MELRPGYKQTEVVGVILEDWSVKKIKHVAPLQRGFDLPNPKLKKGDYPVVYSNGVMNYHSDFMVKGPGVITGRSGTIGNVHYVEQDFWPHNTALWVTDFNGNDPKYIYFLFKSINLNKFSTGSGVPTLNRNDVHDQYVVLPKLEEQRTIAAALSDVDALIASLGKLITKKHNIKQGAMQQLLTGKKRLPGFSGEWKTRYLGDVITYCSSGATPYRGRPEFYKGDIKWITSGELNYNVITDTVEKISQEAVVKTNLKTHPVGTFLMAITGLEAAGTRGACGVVGSPATTNQSCMAIYPTSELLTEYLYHYYVYRGDELALKYCQGTKQQSYTAKLIKILPIDMPPTVEEQTAIATVLSDMDAEIAAIEARRYKTQAIKQGMMQALLTGKIRMKSSVVMQQNKGKPC